MLLIVHYIHFRWLLSVWGLDAMSGTGGKPTWLPFPLRRVSKGCRQQLRGMHGLLQFHIQCWSVFKNLTFHKNMICFQPMPISKQQFVSTVSSPCLSRQYVVPSATTLKEEVRFVWFSHIPLHHQIIIIHHKKKYDNFFYFAVGWWTFSFPRRFRWLLLHPTVTLQGHRLPGHWREVRFV